MKYCRDTSNTARNAVGFLKAHQLGQEQTDSIFSLQVSLGRPQLAVQVEVVLCHFTAYLRQMAFLLRGS